VFRGVASGQVGAPPAPQGRQTPRFPQLREIVGVGDFEGYVSYGLGLASKTAYRVSILSNPSRLVLDLPLKQLPDTGSSPYPLGGLGVSLLLLGVVLTGVSRRLGTRTVRAPESTR
jgi:LPXTG-motif cell wall-anchored protein